MGCAFPPDPLFSMLEKSTNEAAGNGNKKGASPLAGGSERINIEKGGAGATSRPLCHTCCLWPLACWSLHMHTYCPHHLSAQEPHVSIFLPSTVPQEGVLHPTYARGLGVPDPLANTELGGTGVSSSDAYYLHSVAQKLCGDKFRL